MQDVVDAARKDITEAGYKELKTPEEVDAVLSEKGTTLVMINSTCGCAGGVARPAAAHSVHFDKRPDNLVTVFAGQDREATEKAREYFEGYPPSSPSIALFKDGKLVHFLERHHIEGRPANIICDNLQMAYERFC